MKAGVLDERREVFNNGEEGSGSPPSPSTRDTGEEVRPGEKPSGVGGPGRSGGVNGDGLAEELEVNEDCVTVVSAEDDLLAVGEGWNGFEAVKRNRLLLFFDELVEPSEGRRKAETELFPVSNSLASLA